MKKYLLLVMMTAFSMMAQARGGGASGGVLLSFNAFLHQQTVTTGGSSADSSLTVYDIKLGHVGENFYWGGIYSMRNYSGTGLTTEDGKAYGPSIGYIGDGGFYLMGHYYISAENGQYKNGSGIQADFGYMANVSGAFSVGVELSYRNIEYKKNDSNPNMDSYTVKEVMPLLTAAFMF